MNGAQAHLLLNHIPVLGTVFAAALVSTGAFLKKDDLTRAGLWGLVGAAAAAAAAYFTGEGAEEILEALPGFSEAAVHAHEEAAEAALAAGLALGAAAAAVLFRARARAVRAAESLALLALSLPALGLLAWAAHLGGLIRHTELR